MRYLRGTPWLPLAFNLLGCRIGKGVYLDTTDITEFGRLLNDAWKLKRTLSDCVSTPEVDALVEVAQAQPGVFGARLTGGGFGGSVVALFPSNLAAAAAQRIAEIYRTRVSECPTVLVP